MTTLTILKIGGKVLDHPKQFEQLLHTFITIPGEKILVHGGGKQADVLLKKLGVEPRMAEGRRITDKATLEVVTMVYAGQLNKHIVSQLQAKGCNAIGLTGADGNLVLAKKRPVKTIDYGFAGDIESVNAPVLLSLLRAGLIPVCCAITHDGAGQLLNTNADTIAATIAAALSPRYQLSLWYCFEKQGVLLDATNDDSLLSSLSWQDYQNYRQNQQIHGGMIPKLDNAFRSLQQGVNDIRIGNPQSLADGRATQIYLD